MAVPAAIYFKAITITKARRESTSPPPARGTPSRSAARIFPAIDLLGLPFYPAADEKVHREETAHPHHLDAQQHAVRVGMNPVFHRASLATVAALYLYQR